MNLKIRSGIGYDLHRFASGGELFLGGIKVAENVHFEAHSDGDILLHAIIDALLGAAGLEDIGYYFPDKDAHYKNIRSTELLLKVKEMLFEKKIEILNLDCVVICEKVKIQPIKSEIIHKISSILEIDPSRINLKGKSKEGSDATGRGETAECFAIAMIRQFE